MMLLLVERVEIIVGSGAILNGEVEAQIFSEGGGGLIKSDLFFKSN